MKPPPVMPLFVFVLVLASGAANGATIAYWNFNTLSMTAGVPSNALQTHYNPDAGAGSLDLVGWTYIGGATAPHGISNDVGNLLNAIGADPAGQALQLEGGTTVSNVTPNNGASLVLQCSMINQENPVVSFATSRNGPAFKDNQISWSLDGVNYTNFGATYDPKVQWEIQSYDFSSVNALDSAALVYFRIMFTHATAGDSHNHIDNIQINAVTVVPEPSQLLLGALGAGFVLLSRRRS